MDIIQRLFRTFILIAACACSAGVSAQNVLKPVLSNELVRAELMAYAPQGVAAGKTVWVGLQLQHQNEWHTYWKNSGDSGQPTALNWILPPGVTAGAIAWPLPKKIPIGNLANYGYDGTVLLSVPLTITADFKPAGTPANLPIRLQASWLVCKQECVPQDGEFALNLPTQGSYALHAADFSAAFAAIPQALQGNSSITIQSHDLHISVTGLPASLHGKTLDLYPETPEVIETAAHERQSWQNAHWTAVVPIAAQHLNSPADMTLVLAAQSEGQRIGFVTQAKVSGEWPIALAPGVTPAERAPAVETGAALGFWVALLGAFLGGMVLNLMPCVFPVLAIKVLGFARAAGDARGLRRGGLAYSAGVLFSFVALAALMLGLRSAGEQLGWGFQLQSPLVVAALATLFTVIGLNLAGLFEFGQWAPVRLASVQLNHPLLNDFLSGVLAVLVASPCTAPFMGASLGLALSLPTVQALAIFAVLGVGMALPYLLASWAPTRVSAWLPRSGGWMITFRQAMSFPMFATVVWLVWVIGQQSGIDGAAALLMLLLGLAGVLWTLGLTTPKRHWIAALSIAIFAALTGAIGKNVLQPETPGAAAPGGTLWQAWAPGKTEQLLASGSPVFVDFTAAWCVTCQYNKKTSLSNPQVLEAFAAKKVVLLRADWTRRDPAITQALAQLGRTGVPVYVLATPGRAPLVFSEILSSSALLQAVAAL